jgi:hypothetical protein
MKYLSPKRLFCYFLLRGSLFERCLHQLLLLLCVVGIPTNIQIYQFISYGMCDLRFVKQFFIKPFALPEDSGEQPHNQIRRTCFLRFSLIFHLKTIKKILD